MADVCDDVETVLTLTNARTDKTAALSVERLALSTGTEFKIGVEISTALNLTSVATEVRGALFVDTIALTSVASQVQSLSNAVVESISLATIIASLFRDLASSTVTLTNATTTKLSVEMQSALALTTTVTNPLSAVTLVSESLVLTSSAAQYMVSYISESLSLTSVAAPQRNVVDLASSTVTMTSTALQTVDTEQLVVDRLTWTTAVADELFAVQTIVETIDMTAELYSAGGGAWTALTDTWGMSRYEGMDLNSIGALDGVLYAGATDGLYRLTGADDAGTKIAAEVDTGVQNFNEYLKRAAYAYAGLVSDGTIALRITGAPAGVAESYLAVFEKIKANFEVQNRVKLGRGMRSGYWKFAVLNQSGADFRLDRLRIIFEDSSRKV